MHCSKCVFVTCNERPYQRKQGTKEFLDGRDLFSRQLIAVKLLHVDRIRPYI